jgi:ABC-type transporter Mla subunit MlaD
MNLFENICLGTVTAIAAVLLIEGALFLRSARLDIAPIAASTQRAIDNADSLLHQTGVTIEQINEATQKFSAAADQQTAYWQKTQLQVYKLITDTKEIMVRSDRSLNDVLVPRISASLDASTDLQVSAMRNLTDTTARIDDTIDALRPMIDNGIRATAAAATAMSDPAIHETLTHVDGVSGNLDTTSADIQAFVHRETTPVRGTWNVVKKFLQEFAGPAAQVATATK